MNKKIAAIAAGAVITALPLSGCSNESYWYAISGVVEDGQVDHDCPDGGPMEGVAFPVSTAPANRSPARSNPGSPTGKKAESIKPVAPPPALRGSSRTASRKEAGGVKLTKRPEKPEQIYRIPVIKHAKALKGCATEYELFVRNDAGLFEQEVRQADYDKCLDQKLESFPVCTEE